MSARTLPVSELTAPLPPSTVVYKTRSPDITGYHPVAREKGKRPGWYMINGQPHMCFRRQRKWHGLPADVARLLASLDTEVEQGTDDSRRLDCAPRRPVPTEILLRADFEGARNNEPFECEFELASRFPGLHRGAD